MNPIISFLQTHGPMLLAGVTVILLLATLLVTLHNQPIHRQRLSESAMLLCILFLIFACIPLPRLSFKSSPPFTKSAPKYTLQPGDELIAAEVFKFPPPKALPTFDPNLPKKGISPISEKKGISPIIRIAWPPVLSILYLFGFLASTLYLLLGHLLLRRLVIRSTRADLALCNSFNLDPHIHLFISPHTDRPLSFGLFHPTILLPSHSLKNQTQLRHILLHELAHISQHDSLGHFLFNLLFPILYFHPLYWWLRRLTNLSRELIADDLASQSSSRESYVADLLSLARDRIGPAPFSTHALGLFQSKTDFYRRMHMLVQTNQPLSRRCSPIWRTSCAALLIILLMLTSGSLGVRLASAQANDPLAGAADKRIAEAKVAAEERDAEVQRLRAEQADLQAKLQELANQRKQLEVELAAKRDARVKAGDLAAQTLEEKMKAKRDKELTNDPVFAEKAKKAELDRARANERAVLEDWMGKKDPRAVNRDANDFTRPQLDLVSLANSYVDAIGSLKMAEVEATGAATPQETRIAKVRMETAQRKITIFRGIAEAAIKAAQGELESASRLVDQGLAPKSTFTEAQSHVRILEVILAQ